MKNVVIWYLTDNNTSKDISKRINDIGIEVRTINLKNLGKENIPVRGINIFIFDYSNIDFPAILKAIQNDKRLSNFFKFVILKKKDIREAINCSMDQTHIEFLGRPVNIREFLLLLEKSIIVEKYRDIMKYISREAESRIEAYEKLMDINRKDIFASEDGKIDFISILNYEKNLMKRQDELNRAIKRYALGRQKDMFYSENKIIAEGMIERLEQEMEKEGKY